MGVTALEYVSLFALCEVVVFLSGVQVHVCVFLAALNYIYYTALLVSGCFILVVNKLVHQCVAGFEMHRATVFAEDSPEFSQILQECTA